MFDTYILSFNLHNNHATFCWQTQFIVDRYVSGNEAHVIADKAKLDYMLALDSPSVLTIPPSDTSFKTPPLDTFLTTPPPNTSLTTPGNKANTVLNENQKDKPITENIQMRNQ